MEWQPCQLPKMKTYCNCPKPIKYYHWSVEAPLPEGTSTRWSFPIRRHCLLQYSVTITEPMFHCVWLVSQGSNSFNKTINDLLLGCLKLEMFKSWICLSELNFYQLSSRFEEKNNPLIAMNSITGLNPSLPFPAMMSLLVIFRQTPSYTITFLAVLIGILAIEDTDFNLGKSRPSITNMNNQNDS